jgi:hypothetical protein
MQELHCIDGYACESEKRRGFCHREDHEELLVFWKKWELNLALKTAHTKFFIVLSGGCELLSIKVRCMTVLAFYIHESY